MPVLRVEMTMKLGSLLYRRMFLNIIFFFLIRVGPVFQARAGTITNFIFICGLKEIYMYVISSRSTGRGIGVLDLDELSDRK